MLRFEALDFQRCFSNFTVRDTIFLEVIEQRYGLFLHDWINNILQCLKIFKVLRRLKTKFLRMRDNNITLPTTLLIS